MCSIRSTAYADCELPRDRPAPTLALTAYRMTDHHPAGLGPSRTPRPHSGAKPCLAATLVYLGMGDRERATDYLERGYAANSEFLVWLGGDPRYDSLRSEPRFVALLKRLNFAE